MSIFESSLNTTVSYTAGPSVPPGGATVTVGAANLKPAPFVNLAIEQYKINDIIVGGALIVNLNGTVVSDGGGFADVAGQINGILGLAKNSDCIDISINCNGTSLVSGKGRIRNITADEGPQPTWVNVAPYGIEIEVYENNGELVVEPDPNFAEWVTEDEIIKGISETISLNIDADAYNVDAAPVLGKIGKAHAKASFSISVTGGYACVGTNKKTSLKAAEAVLLRRLNNLSNMTWNTGTLGGEQVHGELQHYKGGARYLHFRSVEVNPFDNTISVNGDMVYRPSGCQYPGVFMDVNVESNASNDSQGRTVTVSGNIQGIPNDDYSTIIKANQFANESNNKFGSAQSAYSSIEGGFLALAKAYLLPKITDPCSTSSSNPNGPCGQMQNEQNNNQQECELRLVSKSVTRNFGEGSLSFNNVYSTQKNCSIPGAKNVDVEVTHNRPTDVTAEFTVIGRGYPLIQNLNTKTRETIGISASANLDNNDCNIGSSTDSSTIQQCLQSLIDEQKSRLGIEGWFIIRDTSSISTTGSIRLDQEFLRPSCL